MRKIEIKSTEKDRETQWRSQSEAGRNGRTCTHTHTHTHTLSRKRCKGNKTVVEEGRGAGKERRIKREAD